MSKPKEETIMTYVDGFLLAVPKANLERYKDMARTAGDVWKEHGAIDYVECIGDDVPYGELTSFPPRRAGEGRRGGDLLLGSPTRRGRHVTRSLPR
jgi:hypothetical protein